MPAGGDGRWPAALHLCRVRLRRDQPRAPSDCLELEPGRHLPGTHYGPIISGK